MTKPVHSSHLLEQLDLTLAERLLAGGLRGSRLFEWRQARDRSWIIGALGCGGIFVTESDVEACVRGTPGRFLPDQPEFGVIRGMRAAIDKVDEWADRGELPDASIAAEIHEQLTDEHALRNCEPRDAIEGLDHPEPVRVPTLFASLDAAHAYAEPGDAAARESFRRLHPVLQASHVLRALAVVAPFGDFNVQVALFCTNLHLLANGYPPFLPKATDGAEMLRRLAAGGREYGEWFVRVVVERDREMVG